MWFFVKSFQARTSNDVQFSHQAKIKNPWKLSKPNKPKVQLSFCEVKILGWLTIIGFTLKLY